MVGGTFHPGEHHAKAAPGGVDPATEIPAEVPAGVPVANQAERGRVRT